MATKTLCWFAAAGVLGLLLAGAASADTATSLGDRSGEGSTQFTGLAQAPEANLFTGALTTSVPIELPPGRKGMTPELRLQYSSSGGPSLFGYGWDLPIGRIERSTKHGVPRCEGNDNEFILVLPGTVAELVNDPPGSDFYRPRIEQSYVRAQKFVTENKWIVHDRAGLKYVFGDVYSARAGTNPNVFESDAGGVCNLTTSWALTSVEDPNGNSIQIAWWTVANVHMPFVIRYGGNTPASLGHIYEVQFGYALRDSTDHVESFRSGAKTALFHRLTGINVATLQPSFSTIRSYRFTYDDDDPDFEPEGHQSILSAVEVLGTSGVPVVPAQHLVYTPSVGAHGSEGNLSVPLPSGASRIRKWNSSGDVSQTVMDMNGDALLDLVRTNTASSGYWLVHFGSLNEQGSFAFDSVGEHWTLPNGIWGFPNPPPLVRMVDAEPENLKTQRDTFDITGDGIPDYVDATSTPHWTIYPGRMLEDGSWGFAAGSVQDPEIDDWDAPMPFLRWDKTFGSLYNTDTVQDTIDMNGDGRPDLVYVDFGAAETVWEVYLNTGSGFDLSPVVYQDAPEAIAIRENPEAALMDFNGDGLPDFLSLPSGGPGCNPSLEEKYSCLSVRLNTGQGFAAEYVLRIPFGTLLAPGSRGLLDINGDGLPDWAGRYHPNEIAGATQFHWRVLLNLGGTMEEMIWVPDNLYPLGEMAVPARVWQGGEELPRWTDQGNNESRIDMIDINGDGLLDRIDATTAPWTVQLNTLTQRPNLLAVMENGLGGTNNVFYEPSTRFDNTGGDGASDLPFINWLVAGIRQNDGFCDPPEGANVLDPQQNNCIKLGHDLVSEYIYVDGRFDGETREFRGFRYVTTRRIEHVEGTVVNSNDTLTTFGQEDATKGQMISVNRCAGSCSQGPTVASEEYEWDPVQVLSSPQKRWRLRLIRRTQRIDDLHFGGLAMHNHMEVDHYGNVTHSWSCGTNLKRVDTYIEYATPNNSTFAVYDRPSRTNTYEVEEMGWGCQGTGAKHLEGKTFYYDGGTDGLDFGQVEKGNVKRVVPYLATGASPIVRMTYDSYGNILTTKDPNGGVTQAGYDDYGLHVVTMTNALMHTTTTEIDYRWGKPKKVIGPNGSATDSTQYGYDDSGRLTCVALPGDTLSSCTIRYAYTFASPTSEYSNVTIERKQGQSPTPPLVSAHYFDALGRKKYTAAFRIVDGEEQTVRTDDVDYDAGGRVKVRYHPYFSPPFTRDNGETRFDYHLNGSAYIDPLGRLHETTYSDTRTTRTEYEGPVVKSYDEAGFRTTRLLDGEKRVVRETTFDSSGPYAHTDYTYDGLGRLLTTQQNDDVDTKITNVYDTLGRKVRTTDPDSGVWEYGYDANGNLTRQEDPQPNQHIQMCYDALNRPTRRCRLGASYSGMVGCSAACPGEEVLYKYDGDDGVVVPNSKGLVTLVRDTTGETRIDAYDERGRAVQTTRSIESALIPGPAEAVVSFTYNEADQLTSVTYPDGEVVHTFYDESGQPIALSGDGGTSYVSDVRYDVFGRITDLEHGNGVADTRTYYGASQRHRLETLESASASDTHLALAYYQYDARGSIHRILDNRDYGSPPLSNEFMYGYDHLGRLSSVAGPLLIETYGHDTLGNLTTKGNLSFQYDNPSRPHRMTSYKVGTGPQIPEIDIVHDDNGNRTDRGDGEQLYQYDCEDRLESIDLGSEMVRFGYDHAGQMTVKAIGDTPAAVWTRYFNQYVETTSAGRMTKWYFLGGMRVASETSTDVAWQSVAAVESPVKLAAHWAGQPVMVVALGPGAPIGAGIALLVMATGVVFAPWRRKAVVGIAIRKGHVFGVVLVFAFGTLPWPLVIRPAEAECENPTPTPIPGPERHHYHYDHLGSTQVITDGNGDIVEQIRYKPYGEVRGRWDENGVLITSPELDSRHEFTGYETEILSGLAYAGARFYDPVLGTFLTHDPAREFANPYSYVGGDPVNLADPSGACIWDLCIAEAFIIGAVIGGVASAIQAAAGGARGVDVLKAAAIGGAIGGVTGVGLGFVGHAAHAYSATTDVAFNLALAGSAGYSTYEGISSGNSAATMFGAVAAAFALYGLANSVSSFSQGAGSRSPSVRGNSVVDGGPPNDSQLAFVDAKYDPETGELIVTDIDTGVRVKTSAESGGRPFGDPIESGGYEILEHGRNPDSFRLDAVDAIPRNDTHDPSGRTHFRLHGPGRTIGCIACSNRSDWTQIKSILNGTSTTTVPDRATPWWRRWTTGPEAIRKYGTLTVE